MKSKYSINNNNQLLIKPSKKKKTLAANGRFSIDKYNRLIYWLNESASWQREYNLPKKIRFIGKWNLNPNYDLVLNLTKTRNQYKGNRLMLKGQIISADRDNLDFEIRSYGKRDCPRRGTVPGYSHIQLLKLAGSWHADKYNRIIFIVKKKASPDILILKGIWQLNKNQQIIYNYEKTNLITKTKTLNSLIFKGFWQITSKNKLTYILEHGSKSRFNFRVQIETPNIYPKRGVIKYRLGIGIREQRLFKQKIVSLYGIWKFSKKLGLNFLIDYGKGRVSSIEFGMNVYLNTQNDITFSLTNKKYQPLGLFITLTHRFLKKKDTKAFLKFKKLLKRDMSVEAGMRMPF